MASVLTDFPWPHSGNIELFDYYASKTIANGVTDFVFDIPIDRIFVQGYATMFGHGIDDPTAFAGSTWQVCVNDIAMPYYDAIKDELGQFKQPEAISPIIVRRGEKLGVRVINASGASHLYAARLRGFLDYGG